MQKWLLYFSLLALDLTCLPYLLSINNLSRLISSIMQFCSALEVSVVEKLHV